MTVVDVHVFPTDGPDDTSGLEEALESGRIDPESVVAVLGKTEGNGCVNDFSRGLATMAYERALATALDANVEAVREAVTLIMSGGTEGVMTPHVTVITRAEETEEKESGPVTSGEKRLAAGTAETKVFEAAEIGRRPQIRATAAAVQAAMDDAGIEDPGDVEFVQVKCPLLTAERMARARDRGESVAVEDTYESMACSRGASALGVGVATGELEFEAIADEHVCDRSALYSTVASTSAGVELEHSEVLVFGNSEGASSDLVVSSAVMDDALDADAVRTALSNAGVEPSSAPRERVRNVFAKAEVSRDGRIRGRRHVVHNDSDINATRHARAVVSAVIGSVAGDPLSYVSGGAEHQGPGGGGPVAVIADAEPR